MKNIKVIDDHDDSELSEDEQIPEKKCTRQIFAKKKEKSELEEEEKARIVEYYMAIFEIACEEDIILNKESKPCINKLKFLQLLIQILSKKYLQKVFINHGIFTLLKNWLEFLPDGSLPNFNVRQTILEILTHKFQIDVNNKFVRDQLTKSGLAKVIMFLSHSNEETSSNQKLAKDLVFKWSRDIYNISTRFEDARSTHNETINKRPCIRKPIKKAPVAKDDDFELEIYEFSSGHKKRSNSYFKSRAQIPEATSMTFVVSPPSKVDKNQSVAENKHHNNIVKTLRKMKTAKHARQIAKFAY